MGVAFSFARCQCQVSHAFPIALNASTLAVHLYKPRSLSNLSLSVLISLSIQHEVHDRSVRSSPRVLARLGRIRAASRDAG